MQQNILTVLQVELLIPQLQFLDDEGAQGELWELSRIFLDTLIEKTKSQVSGMYSRSYKLLAQEMYEGFSEFIMIFLVCIFDLLIYSPDVIACVVMFIDLNRIGFFCMQ